MGKEIKMIGSGAYEVAPHQQFTDMEGNLVRTIKGSKKPIPVGEAYAFFRSKASQEDVQKAIPRIKEMASSPSELELYLISSRDVFNGKVEVEDIVCDELRLGRHQYAIKANYPTATNSKTADELAAIVNQAYQSPLFSEGEDFIGRIYYKEKDRYVTRD